MVIVCGCLQRYVYMGGCSRSSYSERGDPATGGGGYSPDVSHGAYNGTNGIH